MSSDSTDQHDFGSAGLAARVRAQGAELCALADETGHPYLWPASPAWPRHAPNLFPIVGRLAGDTLRHQGRSYRLTQHGFARDLRFTWITRGPDGCTLALTDDAATRAMYPFPFRFEITFAAWENSLSVTYAVHNTGPETLPVSMGAHPAFRWPLQPDLPKEAYRLVFDANETAPLRGVVGGLLTEACRPCPIHDRVLPLLPSLFDDDALILSAPNSRSVHFSADEGPSLTVAWDGFEQLGLWSKPGGDFLCIEPWQGMASPAAWDGDISEKPWSMLVPPGQMRRAVMTVTLHRKNVLF
jgi:galactose mutarotase-like enzyme